MRKILRNSVLFILLLCPAFCWAQREILVHNFDSLSAKSQLRFTNSNRTAKTPELWYKCTGGATFGLDNANPQRICINLTNENHVVTTSALDSLSGVQIWYSPNMIITSSNLRLQLSRDSVHWSDTIPANRLGGRFAASFVPGRYYVRLTNTSSNANRQLSIFEIWYSFGDCNCMMYIPE